MRVHVIVVLLCLHAYVLGVVARAWSGWVLGVLGVLLYSRA